MSLKEWFKSLYKTAELQAEPIIDDLNKLRGIKKKPKKDIYDDGTLRLEAE